MPGTRPSFDTAQLLRDDDCDIMDEYSIVVDGAMDMRRKFSLVVSQARQLEAALREKQADIDRLTALQQKELSNHQHSAGVTRKKLRGQGRHLQRSRETNKELRRLNEEQARDLEVMRKDLDQFQYLRCKICCYTMLNTVTRCGHVHCKSCLDDWREESSSFTCPCCRRVLLKGDVWEIRNEPDSKASPVHDESDDATEVLMIDSDSE